MLSPYTLPREYLETLTGETTDPRWKETFQLNLNVNEHFEETLARHRYIELCKLATVDEIRSGSVPIACHYKTYENHPVYTPETYAMHLQYILSLMDRYENYYFLPVDQNERQDYNLFVNECGQALLVRNSFPLFLLEIRRPELSMACHEYLMHKAELIGFDGIHRAKIRLQISELVRELLQ